MSTGFGIIKDPELKHVSDVVAKHYALKSEALPKKLRHFTDLGQDLPVEEGEPFTGELNGVQYFCWKINGEIVTLEGTQL